MRNRFTVFHDIVQAVSGAWKNTLTPFLLLPLWLAAGEEWKQGCSLPFSSSFSNCKSSFSACYGYCYLYRLLLRGIFQTLKHVKQV